MLPRLTYLLLFILPYVFGGTRCPPRSTIYPCICLDRSIGKSRYHSTVICQGLSDGGSIMAIEPGLSNMTIDSFLLYDAYWSNELRSVQFAARVPINFLTTFKIVELEVVDSKLTSFGCPDEEENCRTNVLKRFTAINVTMPERPTCNSRNVLNITSWVSCPESLQELTLDNCLPGTITKLRSDFFPGPMTDLKVLSMPNNRISEVDKRTFRDFPSLEKLDLSHNLLRDVKNMFSEMLNLKYIDLSYNNIRSGVNFQHLPKLTSLMLNNNEVTNLLQNDWTSVPEKFRFLDLRDNNINCGCGIRFLNSTFHINAVLNGTCGSNSPDKTKGKTLRKACRFLIERCDPQGNIGAKRKFGEEA